MTKHVHVIDATDADNEPTPAEDFGTLEKLFGKAKLLNPPDSAKYRLRITMGGKIRSLTLEWND